MRADLAKHRLPQLREAAFQGRPSCSRYHGSMDARDGLREFGQRLACGRTAEIFAWDQGQILKLFFPAWGEEAVRDEARRAQAVFAAGLPVPGVYGVVEAAGRYGIVYEKVSGASLVACLQRRPWRMAATGRLLADLHMRVHEVRVPELPSLRESLAQAIERAPVLSLAERTALRETLAELPGGVVLCHGDFHPDNVLLTARGPVIIDWADATQGNPWADVARTSLLVGGGALPPGTPGRRPIEIVRRSVHRSYLRRCFGQRRPGPDEWRAWRLVVAAARLAERVPGEEEQLLATVRTASSG